MTRIVAVPLGVLLSLWLIPVAANAQTTDAAIAGVVKDASGAVLPGVTVEAASPALIEKVRTAVTDAEGQYKIIGLRPGTYTVTFSLPAFSTVRREGLELPAAFTASISPVLKVGSLEETVTVSGQSPVVDVQNVTEQQTLSKTLIDTIPIARSQLGFAALMPAVISPPNAQDVGGSIGELTVRMAIHGGKQADQKLLQDGMRYNSIFGGGTGKGYFVDPATVQEMVIELGAGGAAEFATGGTQINAIPKDGGNKFSGSFFTDNMNSSMESSNLTPELQARGLQTVGAIQKIYDVDGAFGGPIVRDKLWFYTGHRRWGTLTNVANNFHNATPNGYAFTPDLSKPTQRLEDYKHDGLRFTWQATPKQKITASFDWEHTYANTGTNASTAFEAVTVQDRNPDDLGQITWTYPATNKFLFEAGWSVVPYNYTALPFPEVGFDYTKISVLEQTTNFRYVAPSTIGHTHTGEQNQRLTVSYVTGSHHFKTGLFMMEGTQIDTTTVANNSGVTYTFSGGTPISLTQYASPTTALEVLRPELGIFAQDQWTLKRLTLNAGLRFDYLRTYIPAIDEPAGLLVNARHYDQVDCIPCWEDLTPRFGASFDVFGNGKTAIKMALGKYVTSETTLNAQAYNPATTSVLNATRSWNDTNVNFRPDCDLRNPLANGECGALPNALFGLPNVTTRADPDTMNGWGKRSYNWQTSVSIQHELMPGLAVGGGYFHTWYGNFLVTDNLSVTPADYDPYCITAPVDPRLPGGGGNQICGLYNLNPSKVGQVNNLVTFASHYGIQTETYDGVDANFNARLPHGAQLAGGWNIGNSVSAVGGPTDGITLSHTNNCFVVDSPQQLYQCNQAPPFQSRFKIFGSYPLPWDVVVSANFQSVPSAPYTATYSATTAQVAQSLGRPLSGGARTVAIELIPPNSLFESRINQLDLRMSKNVHFRRARVQGMFDIFNALNASPILSDNVTYGPNWKTPLQILAARMVKLGLQVVF